MAAAAYGGRGSMDEVRTVRQTRVVQQRQQLLTPDAIDGVDWVHCYSAPQSRSGSFKKPRRPGLKARFKQLTIQ